MDTESVSNPLFSRLSFERSALSGGDSPRRNERAGDLHPDHPLRRAGRGEGMENRQKIDHGHEKRGHDPVPDTNEGTLAYRRSERTALMIETQEGDFVRLKIRASESLSVDASQDDDDGSTISEIGLQARSSVRVSFKVKGDLNAEELASIQSVIEQAGSMANDFFAGNYDGAFATASAFEMDATRLATIRIRMRSSEQLTYPMASGLPALVRDQSQAPDTTTVTNDTAGNGPEAAVIPATGETIAETGEGTAVVMDPQAPVVAKAGSELTGPGGNQGQVMAGVLQSIGLFLNNLLEAFAVQQDAEDDNTPGMTLKLQVFRSMLLSIGESGALPGAESATTLAAETIDAITVQETPLNEVA